MVVGIGVVITVVAVVAIAVFINVIVLVAIVLVFSVSYCRCHHSCSLCRFTLWLLLLAVGPTKKHGRTHTHKLYLFWRCQCFF